MRNFWYQSGSGHAVGAAPCGRPSGVIGGEAPYTEIGWRVGSENQ